MKKYRQFIIGFVFGAMLFTGVFAEDILNITINTFPIFVNGQQTTAQSYIINDYTYVKLSDIGKMFDSTVSFNQTLGQIEINSNIESTITPIMQTSIPKLTLDKTTGEPIGAKFVNYKGYDKAVLYNNEIYFPGRLVSLQLNIFASKAEGAQTRFTKDGKEAIIDISAPNSCILVDGRIHYNVNSFESLIGE